MNRFRITLAITGAAIAIMMISGPAQAAVQIGGSALIGTLDYSDTFTTTEDGGIAGRNDGVWGPGLGVGGQNVENNHGNTARVWPGTPAPGGGPWSINSDSTAAGGYPGTSGAGSDTGITQTGGAGDWGFEYGLRDEFVVQLDAVQTSDRIDITASTTANTIAGGLSVFIRPSGHGSLPEIGLFNAGGEIDSGLTSSTTGGQWHNFAVRFDIPGGAIEVFIDEVSRGVIDLVSFNGGSHNTASNAFVNVGGNGSAIMWTDNFQVGASIPTPAALPAGLALLGFAMMRRRHKH